MKKPIQPRLTALAAILSCVFAVVPSARSATPAAPADGDDAVVSIGHDSTLAAGQSADSVVSIVGSSTNDGHAGNVVSVLGNTRVTGSVDHTAVAVLGNTYINGTVGKDAVTVLGNMTLGPQADIGGDVTVVGGSLYRDPAAIIRGSSQSVRLGPFGDFNWFHPWIEQCLRYARPLAVGPGLAWAWGVAAFFLALYLVFALLFRDGLMQCVRTIETKPGQTVVAALLTMLLMPILLVLMCITVIGIAAVPFVLLGLLAAGLFGKAVILAWLGRACLGRRNMGALGNPALAVLIGGAILLLLYIIPVVGVVAQQVFALLGLGVVVYTLMLKLRARQNAVDGGTPVAAAPAAADATDAATATAAAPGPGRAAQPAVAASMPRAGFWIRIAALFVDAVLIGVLTGLVVHMGHAELLALAVYGAVMWKLRGSTVGGIVFHLRVVRLDGREVDWATAVVRALACFLSLAVAGLGFIWIAFDENKQAWHDKIAGTVVVRLPTSPSLV